VSSDKTLTIDNKRAIMTGRADNRLLQLSSRLEGQKRWLKTGGFSFEATEWNLDHFMAFFPEAKIEDLRTPVQEQFASEEAHLPRGAFVSRIAPFPHQTKALVASGHIAPSGGPDRPPEAGVAAPDPWMAFLEAHKGPETTPDPAPKLKLLPRTPDCVPAKVFAIFGDMGTGKTRILIDMAATLWCAGEIDAMLVISPKGVHEQWVSEQLPIHMSESVAWFAQAIDNKRKILDWPAEKLAIISVNIDYPRTKNGFENCEQFIKRFNGRVMIVVDESHKIKTFTALRTEAIIALGRLCKFRRIATGTPISKNLVDAFSQFYFLDPRIFGQNYLATFRSEYCIMGGPEGRDVVASKNVEQFYERIAAHSFRITKEEADLGLPPKHYVRYAFDLSPEQRHHYSALKEDMITRLETGKFLSVHSALPQLLRLQQVACGFLTNGDVVQPLENARIEALQEVIEEREGKIAIWCRFNEDIKAIKQLLGNEAVTYHGATSSTDREKAKELFLSSTSNIRFFVSNPSAGGTGLNLQGDCRTVIYYSNSFNAIDRWQSEDRVHRIGAKGAVTYIDLVARATCDARILSNLRGKKSLSDFALDDIRQMLED